MLIPSFTILPMPAESKPLTVSDSLATIASTTSPVGVAVVGVAVAGAAGLVWIVRMTRII